MDQIQLVVVVFNNIMKSVEKHEIHLTPYSGQHT